MPRSPQPPLVQYLHHEYSGRRNVQTQERQKWHVPRFIRHGWCFWLVDSLYLQGCSLTDVYLVLGWESNGGDNQRVSENTSERVNTWFSADIPRMYLQWKLEQVRGTNQWHLQNQHNGKYLSIALGAERAGDDTPVVASEREFGWDINHAEDVGAGYRRVLSFIKGHRKR